MEPLSPEEVALQFRLENVEQEVNIEFPIEPQEPVINATFESTQEMMAEKPEAIAIVSSSLVTLAKKFTHNISKDLKDKRKNKTSKEIELLRK